MDTYVVSCMLPKETDVLPRITCLQCCGCFFATERDFTWNCNSITCCRVLHCSTPTIIKQSVPNIIVWRINTTVVVDTKVTLHQVGNASSCYSTGELSAS